MREVDNNYNVTKEKIGLYKDSGDFQKRAYYAGAYIMV